MMLGKRWRPIQKPQNKFRLMSSDKNRDPSSCKSSAFFLFTGFTSVLRQGNRSFVPCCQITEFKNVFCISFSRLVEATAVGVVIKKPAGEILFEVQKKLGYYVDEIVAEHLALIEGLMAALEQGVDRIHAFTGSEVLYNQVARGRNLENQLLWAVRERVLDYVRKLDDFMLTFNVDSADGRNVTFMAREAIYPSSIPRSVVALHAEYDEEDEDNGVLSCGLGQKRQRSYGQGRFHAPTWGGTSEFNGPYPRTQALGINGWKEREKGIGEWKFL